MTSRREFLAAVSSSLLAASAEPPLQEVPYGAVTLAPGLARQQFESTRSVLLAMNEDSLLKPWRLRAGLPAPGPDLGGWYDEVPLQKTESGGHGFAPAHSFGQWISALARGYAVDHDPQTKAKLQRLLALYEPAISGRFYSNFRFPAYNFDKMVIGLIDARQFAGIAEARQLLERTTDAAEPHLPPTALDRDEPQRRWRASVGESTANDYTWDESYTLPENLFLAYQRGAGQRYRRLAQRFLLDRTYFDPLAANRNVLANHHAYSFCNALSSAMQAYLTDGSHKHLLAASNAFDMIAETQSFATGGWGPNESFSEPGSGELYKSLAGTHRSFETPCGSYAHFKLTRYLLRVTGNGRYGDSMERVLYNTVLGAKPLEPDGRAFYYSDYNNAGRRTYFPDAWPCCSGTLPQVAADYHILPYFTDSRGLYVNLYLPSTLRWTAPDGAEVALTLETRYPLEGNIILRIQSARASTFPLRLRIPAWAGTGAVVRVNGAAVSVNVAKGFASIERRWTNGDVVELRLPLNVNLEAIDREHPNTVAVVRGPLVLFALDGQPLPATRAELLAAASEDNRFRPFFELQDRPYQTYLTLA